MLSNRAGRITPSVTVELSGKVQEMRERGEDIIALNAGEPDFDTPEFIRDACKRALDEGRTRYTAAAGIKSLRQAICRKLELENGISYTPQQICVSTGAKQALYNAVMAVTDPGDEVIIPVPCWVSYVEIVRLCGGVPVTVPTGPKFRPDPEAVRKAVTGKTKAIIINTPNNPTGAVYSAGELMEIVSAAEEYGFYIISDEVYEKLVYGGNRHISPASLSPGAYGRTVVINGLSKSCAMTGWRMGYSAAPSDIAAGISAIQGHTTSNSTSFVQYASQEALERGAEDTRRMVSAYEERGAYMRKRLSGIPGIKCSEPEGAFYLLPDVSGYFEKTFHGKKIGSAAGLSGYLLEEAKVVTVPGEAFFAPDSLRLSYTCSMENIKKGMDRIEKALNDLWEIPET